MNYQTMNIKDIINWCKENKQVDWLKAKAAEMVDYEVYPRVKVTTPEGKVINKVDKTAKPTIEKRKISFIQIKMAFVEEFMPEIAPSRKPKKPTMYDLIASL